MSIVSVVPLEGLTDTFAGITLSLMATTRPKFSRQFLRFAVSDTEEDPGSEMLRVYDTVLSTNCIHATPDLVRPTTHIRKMLQPDVVICPVELTRWSSSELMVWVWRRIYTIQALMIHHSGHISSLQMVSDQSRNTCSSIENI
ncbi:hypothetical protein PENFLA_c016G01724 [Penicillium flavigenum]|uniref:Uncharacterized protein n=1 Tax=Penicillium flavigenum TaxID=254877 RepID=A0A1V6T385_9EURO|nr:hypothetical protein PENFLA_c016G01724 [Penicillium flavigenum]